MTNIYINFSIYFVFALTDASRWVAGARVRVSQHIRSPKRIFDTHRKKNRIRTKIQVQHINRPHQAPIQSNHLMCDFKWPLLCCRLNVVLPESGYRNTTVWTTSLRPITDEINLNFGTKSSVCGYSSQVIIIIDQKKIIIISPLSQNFYVYLDRNLFIDSAIIVN